MIDWYLINPQPTLNSGFEKDEFTNYAQDGFNELLTETQLGKDIIFCKGEFDGKNFEVEVPSKGIIQSETPDTYVQGYKRQFLSRIGEIADYQYIKYDGSIWLIMIAPADNCIYDKCVLHLCNYVLKWQNFDKKIIYCPASIENASQYNMGEEQTKILTLGYNQLMIYVPITNETVVIDRKLRFFIDYNKKNPLPYKVTRHDTVSNSYGGNRIMCIVATEDQYNPNRDSIEDWLCDYYEVSEVAILYDGQPTIRAGGTKMLRINTDKEVNWSVEGDVLVDITPNGNSVKVKCPNNQSYIGKKIVIKAVVDEVEGVCELTVTGGV